MLKIFRRFIQREEHKIMKGTPDIYEGYTNQNKKKEYVRWHGMRCRKIDDILFLPFRKGVKHHPDSLGSKIEKAILEGRKNSPY